MKKTLKIIGISIASLITLFIITLFIVLWIVVTPQKITPIVRNQIDKFILCPTHFDTVDITFFSTFPHIGLQIKNLTLINPMLGAPSDTLACIEDLIASLNIKELLFNDALKITKVTIHNAHAHLFVDSNGNTNFNIVEIDTTDEDTAFILPFDLINIQKISIKNLNADYTDDASHLFASIDNVKATIKGELTTEDSWAKLKMESGTMNFNMHDSVPLVIKLAGFKTNIEGKKLASDIRGNIDFETPQAFFRMDTTSYLNEIPVTINIPFVLNIDNQRISLDDAEITLEKFRIFLDGKAQRSSATKNIDIDMAFKTNTWNIPEVMKIIPAKFKEIFKDMTIDGNLELNGHAKGIYNDSLMPVIKANILYSKGIFAYASLDLPFKNINADLLATIDLNADSLSMVTINSLKAQTGKSTLDASGNIVDIFNEMLFKLKINGNLELVEIKPVLPSDMNLAIKGKANVHVLTNFALNDLQNLDFKKMNINGNIQLKNLETAYNDSIFITSPNAMLKIASGGSVKNKFPGKLFHIEIQSGDMDIKMIDVVNATLKDTKLKAWISDFRDTSKMLSVDCDFDMGNMNATMDTISANIYNVSGSVAITPSKKNKKNPEIHFTYSNEKIVAKMGDYLKFNGDVVKLKGKGIYDTEEEGLFLQWSPNLSATIQNGLLRMSSLSVPVEIPFIIFDFTPEKFVIDESQIILDKSNFKLSGIITHIDQYYKKTGLLKCDLNFVSDNTHINQLMDIVSGFGASDSATAKEEVESKEDNPFMVPLGVVLTLNTWVKNAIVGETTIQNVQGNLTIKDGIMVLEEIGFTSKAAKMQLTAIYRSPRKNHLFAGIDFHLLDVDIEALINMIPEIDTLVPMLKSFAGKAEFHLAAETYMKSNYDLKISTLRGAAALEGQDLVLMDGETFSEIAKLLMFNKKTKNTVDSISVEMTVYKNEIDLYPFLIVMDKYKAVIAGRHNLDMNFDYHISITDSPLPVRLGLDVKGNMKDLKYKLVPCKYANLYRPERQKAVEKRTIELKKLISDALKENVKQ